MSATTAHSVVEPGTLSRRIAGGLVILYAVVSMIPLFWIFITGFKTPPDSISYPPKVVFTPSLEGYCNLFTTRTRQTKEYIEALGPPRGECDRITRSRDMEGFRKWTEVARRGQLCDVHFSLRASM